MHATLTSKGQLTLPKPARDALNLKAGQRLAVRISSSGTLTLTPQRADALSVFGMLKSRRSRSMSVERMDRAIGEHLAADDRRVRATWRPSKPRARRKK